MVQDEEISCCDVQVQPEVLEMPEDWGHCRLPLCNQLRVLRQFYLQQGQVLKSAWSPSPSLVAGVPLTEATAANFVCVGLKGTSDPS